MATTTHPTQRSTPASGIEAARAHLLNSADEIAKRDEARRLEREADEREAATRPETD